MGNPEAVRVVARDIGAVRRDDVRDPCPPMQEPGDEPIREDEVRVDEVIALLRCQPAIRAVALAPLFRREEALIGKRVRVIITGGNVDLSSFFATLS